jgi:transketolase
MATSIGAGSGTAPLTDLAAFGRLVRQSAGGPSDDDLRRLAARIRIRDLLLIDDAGAGHVGGDMSVIDILTVLAFAFLRIDPDRPDWPDRDRLVYSKGHAAGALYTTLAAAGYFPEAELDTFMDPWSRLNGHPSNHMLPCIEATTGSLGHGLPVAVGIALAGKMDGKSYRTVVVTGDGELEEGSNWEAAMAGAHYGLENLAVIVDRNRLQQGDWTESTMALGAVADKWRAFGWGVEEVDGHDIAALRAALARLPFEPGKPSCIVANTHKGQPISYMKDHPGWHHHVPSKEELAIAIAELEPLTR